MFLDGGQILFVYDYLKVVVMSTRRSNREGMGEDEFFDTPRPSGGYLDSVRSRLRGAFSAVRPNYGSPALADAREEDPLDMAAGRSSDEDEEERGARGQPMPPARPRPRSSGYAKPPRFDGVTISWDEFIMQFETCAAINGWREPEIGQHLFVSLEGEARSYVVGLRLPRLDYRILVQRLESWFGSVDRKESFRSKLQGRRRNPGEAATSYASEIGCLVARAFPGYPEDILRELTLKALLDGLPEGDLKHEIQMHNPQTVEVAVRLIERFENSSKKVRPQVRMVGEESAVAGGDLRVLMVQILEMLKRMEPGSRGKKTVVCFKCGEEGHYKFQCPTLQKQGN